MRSSKHVSLPVRLARNRVEKFTDTSRYRGDYAWRMAERWILCVDPQHLILQ